MVPMANFGKFQSINVLILLSVLTCFSSAPYIGYYLFGHFYSLFSGILSISTFFLAYFYLEKHIDIWIKILLLFMFSFITYGCLMMAWTQEVADFRKGIGVAMKCIYIIGSCLIIRSKYEKYLKLFLNINAIIVVMSIILFFVLIVGIPWEPISFLKQDGRLHRLFFPLGATNAYYLFGGVRFIRIAGYADEPGALALILIYLLALNEFTLKSNLYRIIFFLGGVFTFSMAFFITVTPILVYWFRIGIFKFTKYSCISIIALVLFVSWAFENESVEAGVDALVFNRFEKDDSGSFNGDNRSFAIPQQMLAFKSSPILGVGSSMENVERYLFGYPSFYSYLAMHGIIGYVFFYIPFVFIMLKNIKRKEILLLMAIALNYLQRPSIEEMFPLICLSLIFYSSFFQLNRKYDNNYNSIIK